MAWVTWVAERVAQRAPAGPGTEDPVAVAECRHADVDGPTGDGLGSTPTLDHRRELPQDDTTGAGDLGHQRYTVRLRRPDLNGIEPVVV